MAIKLYWWKGEGGKNPKLRNFGDWLSPMLCEALSGKKVVFAKPRHCHLIAIGSLLKKLHKTNRWGYKRKIAVWGTGSIGEPSTYPGHHNYYAVRGKLSRDKINSLKSPIALGDPGLLCESLWPNNTRQKKFAVGLIPHYADFNNSLIEELSKNSKYFTLINVFDNPIKVIEQIARCEIVLSSSLHGLIIADALKIPNAWIKLSDTVGPNDFKFQDYYSVYNMSNVKPFPLTINDTPKTLAAISETYKRDGLDQIKQGLLKTFPF